MTLPTLVLVLLVATAGCSSDGATSGGAGAGGSGASGGGGGASGSGSGGTGVGGAVPDGSLDAPFDAPGCTLDKPYSSKNAACNACAEQECCVAINACYADSDCDDGYVNCILACALLPPDAGDAGIASCLDECGAQHPAGKAKYDAAIGCADSKCAGPCS